MQIKFEQNQIASFTVVPSCFMLVVCVGDNYNFYHSVCFTYFKLGMQL